ncbi:MAG: glycosyltransferase, partial [Kiritimatiellae bacterium]|nr:glycosyltransferase [Kiritimatiellia bacterium]
MHVGVNSLFLLPGAVGGSETYLIETLRALIPRHDGALTIFTNRENNGLLRDEFGHQARCELLDINAASRVKRIVCEQTLLPRRAQAARLDVLWSPGYTAPWRTPCPQAVSILDMQYRRHPADLTPAAWLATQLLVTMAARRCRRVLAISEFSRREIARYTRARPEAIDVTPLGVAREFAMPASDATPAS